MNKHTKALFETFMNAPKGSFLSVEWERPMKTRKGVTQSLTKRVRAVIRPGVVYDNIATVQDKRETGELPAENAGLPWGEWVVFPYVIGHKDNFYFRFTTAPNVKMKRELFIDGVPATREDCEPLCLKSEFSDDEIGEVFTVKAENIVRIGNATI